MNELKLIKKKWRAYAITFRTNSSSRGNLCPPDSNVEATKVISETKCKDTDGEALILFGNKLDLVWAY